MLATKATGIDSTAAMANAGTNQIACTGPNSWGPLRTCGFSLKSSACTKQRSLDALLVQKNYASIQHG
jgi:hypothetical protein